MANRNQELRAYEVEEGNGSSRWIEVIPVLFFGCLLASVAFLIGVHYYMGREAASTALLVIGGAWAVGIGAAGLYAIVHATGRLFVNLLIKSHRNDAQTDVARTMASAQAAGHLIDGVGRISQNQVNSERVALGVQQLGWKMANSINREAGRMADERAKLSPPAQDNLLLEQLFGADFDDDVLLADKGASDD